MPTVVLKGIAVDLVVPLIFLAYLLGRLWQVHRGVTRPTREMWGTILIGIPLVVAFLVADARFRIVDYFQYLRHGESYVQVVECTVDTVGYGTVTRTLLGNETLWCQDGIPYRLYYTHRATPEKGARLIVHYLPQSRFVVRLESPP